MIQQASMTGLLLGLKGTMNEAELHVIKARLRGGILNKVRRGEYRCPLQTGLRPLQGRKNPNAHYHEPKIFCAAGEDPVRYRRIGRQAHRQTHLF